MTSVSRILSSAFRRKSTCLKGSASLSALPLSALYDDEANNSDDDEARSRRLCLDRKDGGYPSWQVGLLFVVMIVCVIIAYPIVLHPMIKYALGLNSATAGKLNSDAANIHPIRGRVIEKTSYSPYGNFPEPTPSLFARLGLPSWFGPVLTLIFAFVISYSVITFGCGNFLDRFQCSYDSNNDLQRESDQRRLDKMENRFVETEQQIRTILGQLETFTSAEAAGDQQAQAAAEVAREALKRLELDKEYLRRRIVEQQKMN